MNSVAGFLGEMLLYTAMSLGGIVLFIICFLCMTGRVNWKKIYEDLSKIGK